MMSFQYEPTDPLQKRMLNILETIYAKMSVSLTDHKHCYSHFAYLCNQINRPATPSNDLFNVFASNYADLTHTNSYNCDSCAFFGKTYTQAISNLYTLFCDLKNNHQRETLIKNAFLWVEYRIENHRLYNNELFILLEPEWNKHQRPSTIIANMIEEKPLGLIPDYALGENSNEPVSSPPPKAHSSRLFKPNNPLQRPLLSPDVDSDDDEVELAIVPSLLSAPPNYDTVAYTRLNAEQPTSKGKKKQKDTPETPLLISFR